MNQISDGNNYNQSITEAEKRKNKLDFLKLQKMTFIYNSLEDGWKIKKKGKGYILSKKINGKKEVYFSDYLTRFMERNLGINGNK